jgi:GNAT superfamily N-acetyltransferase
VFGESPSVREMVAVLAFGIVAAVWLTLGLRAEFPGLPWWRLTIAALVIADIASGCVANFTRSTNDFYAARPRHRWVFIAVHGHVLVLAAALGADLEVALVVWAYTVVAASVVNLLAGAPAQRFAAGLLLAVALVWIPQMKGLPAPLVVVDCLFVLKVVFAFAVDHRDGARVAAVHDAAVHDAAVHDAAVHDAAVHGESVHGEAVHGEAERAPIRELAAGDRSAFVAVMSAAFAHDPWIETALGPAGAPSSAGRRSAFLSFMFDHTRLLGGSPLGLFDGDRLVACALLESPTPRWRTVLGMVASAVRFAPVAMRLGARRTARLNAYVQRTRQIAPSAPHHYLTMIGVTPSEHRRGWGKQLMQALIARAEGVPTSCGLALDTENPDNVPIYQRWGFVITGSVELDVVCATAMFRTHADEPPPRASPSLAPSRP